MINKIFVFMVVLMVCAFTFSFVVGRIRSNMVLLDIQLTELEEKYAILKNETDSVMEEIGHLLSMNNLNKVAGEKNLKSPTKEQIIELTNDKAEAEA